MSSATAAASEQLLERSDVLATLAERLEAVVSSGAGRLVLVSGEAGVGKTALLHAFSRRVQGMTRLLWGACDPLFAPRPLGPLVDVSTVAGGELGRLVGGGAQPYEVATELLRELARRAPTLLVLEDLHWADEATLDVLQIIARRVEGVRALVLVSYRDDELERRHPLRAVLGELGTVRATSRVRLSPLSAESVAMMAEPHGVDGAALFRATGGNPFFVTEALATGADRMPESVRDAVLARVSRLSPSARGLVDAVAIAPTSVPLWLLEAMAGDGTASLAECVASGTLVLGDGEVSFRHELARLVLEADRGAQERVTLHRRALAALRSAPAGVTDLARLAHHAEAAGDAGAVLRFAPEAAMAAARVGAHREAAAQYARALRFAGELPLGQRADLLCRRGAECYLTDDLEGIEAVRDAAAWFHEAGDPLGEGNALRALAMHLRCYAKVAEADAAFDAALRILESLPPAHELAMARANHATLAMTRGLLPVARERARDALELGERLGDRQCQLHALATLGTVAYTAGDDQGRRQLESNVELGKRWGEEEQVALAYLCLAQVAGRVREYEDAERYEREGIEYCLEHGMDTYRYEITGYMARRLLDRGDWDEAVKVAGTVQRFAHANAVPYTICLSLLAVIRSRRGDPDAGSLVEEAQSIARHTDEPWQLTPPAAAAAEIAWLEGGREVATRVVEATETALHIALARELPWV
ncbi:MAG: AAA family ATPase, partial [Candidatus Dormiibacterota bacterium]